MALVLFLALAILLGLPGQGWTAPPDVAMAPTGDALLASFLQEVVGSRKRLIQVSVVALILGIFFLQWRR